MMIPLKDENPTRTMPVFLALIFLANLGIFVYARMLGSLGFGVFKARYGAIPFELVHGVDAISPTPIPLYLTLLSSMFLHADWMHLGGNLLYLWIFGKKIEDYLGHLRFLGFYLLCGVIAALAHVASDPFSTIPMVGASGAIAGILGAYLAAFPGSRILVLIFYFVLRIPALILLGGWFILQVMSASGEATGVAWYAHITGFLAGYILMRRRKRRRNRLFSEQWEF